MKTYRMSWRKPAIKAIIISIVLFLSNVWVEDKDILQAAITSVLGGILMFFMFPLMNKFMHWIMHKIFKNYGKD